MVWRIITLYIGVDFLKKSPLLQGGYLLQIDWFYLKIRRVVKY